MNDVVTPYSPRGVGARVQRREDVRHLHGRGDFVADIKLPGTREATFVRSPLAHGKIEQITAAHGLVAGRDYWTSRELASSVAEVVSDARHPDWRHSTYPVLATDRVRFVGEPLALVLGRTRADAEDRAELIDVAVDPLEAVVDPVLALEPSSPVLHDGWPENSFLSTSREFGDMTAARVAASHSITRWYSMARHSGIPLETRGCLAYFDHRTDQLVVYMSTQVPHLMRSGIAPVLNLQERQLRIIAPDVGGGFGIKCNLDPEVIAVCAAALKVDHPIRWIEDRYEHLVGAIHARDHRYRVTAHFTDEGDILGLDADILVDVGAYSVWPWTAAMEAAMSGGMLPGPYKIRNYAVTTRSVCTNKPPMGPYRGVARPGACFAIERTIDEIAHHLGIEPHEVRTRNLVEPEDFPYTSVTGRIYDSGRYAESVRRARELIDHGRIRGEQATALDDEGRLPDTLTGVGYAIYTEQTAHGTAEWAQRGLPIVFSFEHVRASIDPSGSLTITTGIQSHGQGLETALSQVAHESLTIDPDNIAVRHGDTEISPYGMGTFASRSMVMAGGATNRACSRLADRVREIAAALMGCKPSEVRLVNGKAEGPDSVISMADVAKAAYLRTDLLPEGMEPVLEVREAYQPDVQTGTYSYATHAAVVEVDTRSGAINIRDYVVVEDCGTVVNPMIVDGQIYGGVAQGIGTALLEEFTYDDQGQPKVTTFLDYLLPGAAEVPEIRIDHMETPSPFTEFGMKGMGEGGAIAPPAAIANAVTDALRALDVAVNETPMTPQRIWEAVHQRSARDARLRSIPESSAWPPGASA